MPSDMQKPSNNTLLTVCLAVIFIVLISVTIVIRIRMLAMPLERDEGEYAYAGQLMLEGVPPYSLAYNMKMPGIYAAYALILAIFGQTQSGIHFAILLVNTATVILLFFITKKLFGAIAGVAASVFFAITSISCSVRATANAENFVIIFALAAILILIKFEESKKLLYLIIAGLLFGIAFMMKQHGIGFILFGYLFFIWNQVRQKPFNYKNIVRLTVIYSFSVILPFLMACLILWRCGVFEKFWFWTFNYAHKYICIAPVAMGIQLLRDSLTEIISSAPVIWLLALLGLLSCVWNTKIRRYGIFLFGLLICSFIAISPGLYFRQHYFVLFLPVVVILAGAGIISIQDMLDKFIKSGIKTAFVSMLIFLTVWLYSFYNQKTYLLETNPVEMSRAAFGFNPFPEAIEIAKFIKSNSDGNDTIAVLGSEPEICFYSHRRSATSYIYFYPLMEPQSYAADMQREVIKQIQTNKPRFVVFVKCFESWLISSSSEKLLLQWLEPYISSHYRQVGLVDMFPSGEILYHCGNSAVLPQAGMFILIGERID